MTKLRVHNFSLSLDGYGAGADQSVEEPLGIDGERLHEWMFETRWWREHTNQEGGEAGVDDDFTRRGFDNIGAWIMGRNMFGPIRGPWPDDEWKGWWGDEPPYHCSVFVLTNHPRESFTMKGGTTFHFVTDGIESAFEQAVDAAGDKDIRIGGGVSTIQQYMNARLLDELHVAIAPVLLGRGERLFDERVAEVKDVYRCVELVSSNAATHVRMVRS